MDAIFPETARVAKELRHGKPYPVQTYTYDDLIWLANVQVGDRLIVKRSVGDTRPGLPAGRSTERVHGRGDIKILVSRAPGQVWRV